jgi:hypothetical protein
LIEHSCAAPDQPVAHYQSRCPSPNLSPRGRGTIKEKTAAKRTCKPGSVRDSHRAAIIPLGRQLPAASSSLPGSRSEPDQFCSLFGLASGGVYRARRVAPPAGALLPHRFTLTARRRTRRLACGGLFSVALSLVSRPVGVTHRPVLRRPDFPPVGTPKHPNRRSPGPLHTLISPFYADEPAQANLPDLSADDADGHG